MIKNNLTSIDNVAIYPEVSFLIFILFFVMLLFWVVKLSKPHTEYLKNIPLDEAYEDDTVKIN